MKNLKKVLALVVALTMVLGTVGFAAYTDVAEDAGEYTAVSTLSSLSILTGYEDGSFKPDGDITRAEFATVVCRALGAKVSGSAVTGFTDVPADHWASAYIAYCAGAGIVNGMGDGTFAPSANVTVEQAVKMLVVALGYEPMAAAKGGYPTGYMVIANTNDITVGVGTAQSAPATRADVATLVFNALDVPMMEQTGFGTQTSYEVLDGSDNRYKTLLSQLDVAKLDGSVTSTPKIGGAEIGTVVFDIDKEYDVKNFDFGTQETFDVAEGVNAADYFQLASTIYVRETKKGDYEIIAIMPGDDSEVMTFGLEDLESVAADKIVYTEGDDEDDITINSAADWYLNYDEKTAGAKSTLISDITSWIGAGNAGAATDVVITVIENDGYKGYDAVIVKKYTYERVDLVEADRNRFEAGISTFTLDFDNEESDITIVDKNGEAMELADFAEDDVISYISKGNKTNKPEWIEIINHGQNVVTGTVNEKKADNKGVYIDGTEYLTSTANPIDLGDEGTFYLTATGRIFDFEISASVAGNYGYIIQTAWDKHEGWDNAWQVKMLTKDNEIVTYIAKDNLAVYEANSDANTIIKQADSTGTFLNAFTTKDQYKVNPEQRIVTYKLDSKGNLSQINKLAYDAYETNKEYNAGTGKLFGKSVEADAVLFNIDVTSENSLFVASPASLIDDNQYSGYAFKAANGKEYDCFIITDGGSEIDYTQDLAIVAGVSTTTVDSNDAKKVRYYVSGEDEVKELVIMLDRDVSAPIVADSAGNEYIDASTATYDAVKPGAIMMFSDNGNGVASAYTVLANANWKPVNSAAASITGINNNIIDVINSDGNNLETDIVFGYIKDYERGNNGINVTLTTAGGDKEYLVERTTNTYTIDNAKDKNKIYVGDWREAEVDKADVVAGCANFYVAKIVDDTLVDFISFSAKVAKR